jgi:hypothetical protein
MSETTVNSLASGTVFKKGFSDVAIFTEMVRVFTGAKIKIVEVENEKAFIEPVANVATKFDLFAEDKKNRIVVEAQHANYADNFERFYYYHLIATAETIASSENDSFPKIVYTLVFFTDRNSPADGENVLVHDAEMKGFVNGKVVKGIFLRRHRLFFIFTKNPDNDSSISEECREWIKAIHDTLTGSVCKTEYRNVQIKRLFERIAADKTTPEERVKMKEEFNQNQLVQEAVKADKIKTARKMIMLDNGMSNLEISSVTGLSLIEIEALRKTIGPI